LSLEGPKKPHFPAEKTTDDIRLKDVTNNIRVDLNEKSWLINRKVTQFDPFATRNQNENTC
jgi:hypothetical protein